jgi:hypothetical protein
MWWEAGKSALAVVMIERLIFIPMFNARLLTARSTVDDDVGTNQKLRNLDAKINNHRRRVLPPTMIRSPNRYPISYSMLSISRCWGAVSLIIFS